MPKRTALYKQCLSEVFFCCFPSIESEDTWQWMKVWTSTSGGMLDSVKSIRLANAYNELSFHMLRAFWRAFGKLDSNGRASDSVF